MSSIQELAVWRSADALRVAFRAEGFGLPDRYAQLASELCEGAFTPSEFIEECNATSIAGWAAAVAPNLGRGGASKGPNEATFDQRFAGMSRSERCRLFFGELEKRREFEIQHLMPHHGGELVLKRAEIRKFAERLGVQHGFSRVREPSLVFQNIMLKRKERTGVSCYFAIDTGGASTGPNGPLDIGIRCFAAVGEPGNANVGFWPHRLVRGLWNYEMLAGAVDPVNLRLHASLVPPEYTSAMVKLGVTAVVRFLDLFLESLDRDILAVRSKT